MIQSIRKHADVYPLIQGIRETEDRDLFMRKLTEIGVKVPRSAAATSLEEAVRVAQEIGYPVMLRVTYALGGLGSGVCISAEEVRERATTALAHSPQVLVEEFLFGWKEVEYEVVRDRFDNCITVCNMENFDPMGLHTGESIIVAPSQTLNNNEYHLLRQISIQVVRHLKIVGECNIQFALDPYSQDYRIIEVNARLSRSSALASKATGYPLAFIDAKLGLGYSLIDLQNSITGVTSACFEPALDYIVVKIPRWDLQKFHKVSTRIGSEMKSVGEIMAIGRTFEEALQKGLRMLQIGAFGLVGNENLRFANLEKKLQDPTHQRIFVIAEAIRQGYSINRIHELTRIDKWFLYKVHNIAQITNELPKSRDYSRELLLQAKQAGFADRQIAKLAGLEETQVREFRRRHNIFPYVKQIDTLAAEYPAQTNYLYTYSGEEDDITPGESNQVIVLGSGAYSIGSSMEFEFDWARTGSEGTCRLFMQLGDGELMDDNDQDGGVGVNLIWTKIDGVHEALGYCYGGGITALAGLSGLNNLAVEIDLDSYTYDVVLDGSVVGTEIPFDNLVDLDTVRFFTDAVNEVNFSGRSFDDVEIKTYR